MLIFFTPSFVVSGIPRTAGSRCRFHSSTHPPQRCSNDYRDISVTSACGLNAVNFSSERTTKRFHRRDARLQSRSFVIRVYDAAGNVIETHEHAGDFKEW